jgi:hypothetical protein
MQKIPSVTARNWKAVTFSMAKQIKYENKTFTCVMQKSESFSFLQSGLEQADQGSGDRAHNRADDESNLINYLD